MLRSTVRASENRNQKTEDRKQKTKNRKRLCSTCGQMGGVFFFLELLLLFLLILSQVVHDHLFDVID